MSSGEDVSTCGLRPSPPAPLSSAASEAPCAGAIVEADDAHPRQSRFERLDHRRQGLLDHQHLHRGVAQDVDLLRHRESPVERHQQGAEPGAGIEQHQDVRVVGGEDGDPVARPHPQLRFQRARGRGDAPGEVGIGQLCAGKADRRLVGREGRVALDESGQVHLAGQTLELQRQLDVIGRTEDNLHKSVTFRQRSAEGKAPYTAGDAELPSPAPPKAVYCSQLGLGTYSQGARCELQHSGSSGRFSPLRRLPWTPSRRPKR